jgi:hypothetical protein
LVSHRSSSIDDAQVLVVTHRPDLFHTPELIGAFIILILVVSILKGTAKADEPRVIFAASFGALPFVLFNQQVLTGRSIQPFHFDLFVANYAVLIGLAILISVYWRHISSRKLVWVSALCLLCGFTEISLLAKARAITNVSEDEMVPVLLRLKDLSTSDGTATALKEKGVATTTVFSPQVDVMRMLPTWTIQGTMLSAGAQDFGTATRQQRKELLFLQLYFSDTIADRFRQLLNQKTDDSYLNFFAPSVIFGDERFIPVLTLHPKPITPEEIESEVRDYQTYVDSFTRQNAMLRPLFYVVTYVNGEHTLSNLDRWYQRDAGEQFGQYKLYRVRLRG